MPLYTVNYETENGEQGRRTVEAASRSELLEQMESEGVFVTGTRRQSSFFSLRSPVKPKDILNFTRLLSVVVRSGLALNQGLRIVLLQLGDGRFKSVLQQVLSEVESGVPLSQALGRHPDVFDNLYTGMVSAGEASGQMGTSLGQLFAYQKRAEELKKELRSALSYPLVVFMTSMVIVAFFMFWLIPRWQKNLHQRTEDLPALSQYIFSAANFLKDNTGWWLLLIGLAAALFFWLRSRPAGRRWLALQIMKVPVFGTIYTNAALVRFSRSMQTLIQNRVLLLDALEIARRSVRNPVFEEELVLVSEKISRGEMLSSALENSEGQGGHFPVMMLQMIRMGEESGRLDELLEHVADFYDGELEYSYQRIQSVIQPLIIIFLGIFVGTLILALVLPMFGGIGKM